MPCGTTPKCHARQPYLYVLPAAKTMNKYASLQNDYSKKTSVKQRFHQSLACRPLGCKTGSGVCFHLYREKFRACEVLDVLVHIQDIGQRHFHLADVLGGLEHVAVERESCEGRGTSASRSWCLSLFCCPRLCHPLRPILNKTSS